jgi:hypothetical protein
MVLQEGIESQAIDRVNRIGQKKPVHVYQLIAENTMESKVLEIQEKKKQLIHQVSPLLLMSNCTQSIRYPIGLLWYQTNRNIEAAARSTFAR